MYEILFGVFTPCRPYEPFKKLLEGCVFVLYTRHIKEPGCQFEELVKCRVSVFKMTTNFWGISLSLSLWSNNAVYVHLEMEFASTM